MPLSYIPLCFVSTIFCTNVIASDSPVSANPPVHIKLYLKEFSPHSATPRYISPRDKNDPDDENIKRVRTKSAQKNKTNRKSKVENANTLKISNIDNQE